jgi:ribosomal protein S18 acetylase RimI-like enzyme
MTLRVDEAHDASGDVEDAVRQLLPQLSDQAPPLVTQDLEEIVASPCTRLLLARDEADGTIRGMLTLVLVRVPTGMRAHVEDVVVDEAARGEGAGELLIREALRLAEEAGAQSVDLTSSPARDAANRLYQRLGFERRETNVYRAGKIA